MPSLRASRLLVPGDAFGLPRARCFPGPLLTERSRSGGPGEAVAPARAFAARGLSPGGGWRVGAERARRGYFSVRFLLVQV